MVPHLIAVIDINTAVIPKEINMKNISALITFFKASIPPRFIIRANNNNPKRKNNHLRDFALTVIPQNNLFTIYSSENMIFISIVRMKVMFLFVLFF